MSSDDIEMAHPQGNDSLAEVATSSSPHEQESTVVVPVPPPAGEAAASPAQGINTSPPKENQEITVANISEEAVKALIREYKSFLKSELESKSKEKDELRGWLMVLATLTASITWNAALNPPGGVWQADDDARGYVAGTSVYHDKNRAGYRLFVGFNMASFLSSMCMLILLSNSWLFRKTTTLIFSVLVSLDLVGLFATFEFGSVTPVHQGMPTGNGGTLIAALVLVVLTLAQIIATRLG